MFSKGGRFQRMVARPGLAQSPIKPDAYNIGTQGIHTFNANVLAFPVSASRLVI
jgi:hypothetical protein